MAVAAIVGIAGTALDEEERALFQARPPLGVILFRRNVTDRSQVSDLAAELLERFGALVAVDQEGGRVARLTAPGWSRRPAAARIGALHRADPAAGERAAFLHGRLIGADLAEVGIGLDCAPVLDRAVPGADAVIGDRAFSADPEAVAVLAARMADGLLEAGVQPVGKHAPGHGRALVDSHLALPVLDAPAETDLLPFRRCSGLPWLMTAHIRFDALDPQRPATLSPFVIRNVIRGAIGFDGVLVSDDLAMHAVGGEPGPVARRALDAGCDVALHCSGAIADTRAVLEAAGEPTPAARHRLATAAAQARERMRPVDRAAAEAEYAALLLGGAPAAAG
ncbi:MAG: beta-N-acetylhexosaminidase [Gluconacetobacter diazotrophicus]|nr:beta-N-acetylhexosaminidase [Gluconacetobacter diazotrophicus]